MNEIKMHSNQRLLAKELEKRGVNLISIYSEIELIQAVYKDHKEFLLDRDSSITPYNVSIISGEKYLTKCLLKREKIAAPKGELFTSKNIDDALIYTQTLNYPLVVKPNFGSHGNGVYTDLENIVEVKNAIEKIKNKPFIIEEQFEGKEYRVFITKNGDYAVLNRDPASVIGNGLNTIEELIEKENYKRMHPRLNALCPIIIDNEYLFKKNKTSNYVPSKNEKVYVRHNSNIASGGICEDYTDKVHTSVIEISKKVLEVFHGMPYAGIDFMTKDVTIPQKEDTYCIIEVNSVPGIQMHMQPAIGTPRNVASYIADLIFPETKVNKL